MAFPLALTNIMFVFWLLINVFQIINLFVYINVSYPLNLTAFFRSFKSFNLSFLPASGVQEAQSQGAAATYFGTQLIDQASPPAFARQGMQCSYLENGLRFTQLYVGILIALVVLRLLKRALRLDPFAKDVRARGFFERIFCTVYQKFEYTLYISFHQSSAITFSLAVYLQFRAFSAAVWANVVSAIIAILSALYFAYFLRWLYRKINSSVWAVHEKVMSGASIEKVQQDVRDEYEKYEIQYDIVYLGVDFTTAWRRNYHFIIFIRNVMLPLVLVALTDYPMAILITYLVVFVATGAYSVLYRPFKHRIVCWIAGANEFILAGVVVMIFVIRGYMQGDKDGSISAQNIERSVLVGWVIIGFLMSAFFLNLIGAIAIEWPTIRDFCVQVKEKIFGRKDQEKSALIKNKAADLSIQGINALSAGSSAYENTSRDIEMYQFDESNAQRQKASSVARSGLSGVAHNTQESVTSRSLNLSSGSSGSRSQGVPSLSESESASRNASAGIELIQIDRFSSGGESKSAGRGKKESQKQNQHLQQQQQGQSQDNNNKNNNNNNKKKKLDKGQIEIIGGSGSTQNRDLEDLITRYRKSRGMMMI